MNGPLALNATYRLKRSVLAGCIGVDGKPLDADVTIVRIKTRNGYSVPWYFDARGNAFKPRDFEKRTEVIELDDLGVL